LAKNQVYYAIDMRYNKIREWISFGDISLSKIHTDKNDMLTR